MQPLAQPPRKEDRSFDDWMYRLWKRIASTAGLSWLLIDKTGASLADIPDRQYKDLQYIPTPPVLAFSDGEDGQDGLQGVQGIPGASGADGAVGPQGPIGFDGIDGEDGISMPGQQGIQGATGAIGPQGPVGFGFDGQDGEDGYTIPGPQGAPGSSGVATVSNNISTTTTISTDTSYIVLGYLNITSDLNVSGNLGVL
jgi:hypothetical protein